MAIFDGLSGEAVTALAVLSTLAAEEVLDTEDLHLLGTFFIAVGSLLLTAAAQDRALTAAITEAQEAKEKKAADKEFADLKDKVEKIVRLVGV